MAAGIIDVAREKSAAFQAGARTIPMANKTLKMGKLLSDEALYLEFQSLLREGRAAVDDMREMSPITTFTSIFFGAF